MLRFDLERALISGDLAVPDLEAAWNDRFAADFGQEVRRASEGVLQDVHWAVGLFGYFPTYALGNVHAGSLYAAMRADLPDLDAHLAAGEPAVAGEWLRERVHRHGGLYLPADLIAQASGAPVSAAPLLDYLEEKFGALTG
jgi:carboxypeptidase Taq